MHPIAHPHLRIGEVVLRTGRYDPMRAWYRLVLELDPYYENLPTSEDESDGTRAEWATRVRLAFFRLALDHPYQQVIALFDEPVTTLGTVTDAAQLRLVAGETRIELTVEQLRAAWQSGVSA